jgi:ABC-type antimicrobial peptide transport system permease subunit
VQARTLADREATRRADIRQAALAVAGAGFLTLLLAGIGLYTVVAFAVGQRTKEVGVRIALGARRGQVIGLFFRGGLRLSAIGLGIGLPLSIIAFQLFAMNVGVRLGGTTVMALAVAAIVVAVSALATWIPARKAAGVDPLITLRSE